jgi:hypothetical protein
MLAGVAEVFARLYGLPKPDWVNKAEYFLPEPPRPIRDESEFGFLTELTPGSADFYRAKAKTAKEMLRRNVIFPVRNLAVL